MLCVAHYIYKEVEGSYNGGPTASPSKSNISAQTCRTAKEIRSHLFTKVSLSKEYGLIIAWANLATNGAKISSISAIFIIHDRYRDVINTY
jgi:hypothetical protein